MPTYADQLDLLLRSGGAPTPRNPVGSSMRTLDGDLLMLDDEPPSHTTQAQHSPQEIDMIDLEVQPSRPLRHGSTAEDWRDAMAHLRRSGTAKSIWVLDTNVLVSSLDLLQALCTHILAQNAASLCDPAGVTPSPIALAVPYIVIRELDAQKTSDRQTSKLPSPGSRGRTTTQRLSWLARAASRWILSTLKAQKNLDINGSPLPASYRALYVQPHSHFNATRIRGACNNDEQIVAYCKHLQADVGGVVLVTDDSDAAISVMSEEVDSLQIRAIVQALVDQPCDDEGASASTEWSTKVPELVEQWVYQMGGGASDGPQPTPARASGQAALDAVPAPSQGVTPSHAASPLHPASDAAAMAIEEVQMHEDDVADGGSALAPTTSRARLAAVEQPSPAGRKTSDSMHAPAARGRARATSPNKGGSSACTTTTTQAAGGDELNPHIEWDSLVPSSAGRRARPRW